MFAEDVIWAAILLMIVAFAIPFFPCLIFYIKFPDQLSVASGPGGKGVGEGWMPKFKLVGPLAAYVVLVSICIGFSYVLIQKFFTGPLDSQTQHQISQFFRQEEIDWPIAQDLISEGRKYSEKKREYRIDEYVFDNILKRREKLLDIQDKIIGQYCWVILSGESIFTGRLDLIKSQLTDIEVRGSFAMDTEQGTFSSQNVWIAEKGISYNWEVSYLAVNKEEALGFASLKFGRRDEDKQVLTMKGKFATFGTGQGNAQGRFSIVRLSQEYGLNCTQVGRTYVERASEEFF